MMSLKHKIPSITSLKQVAKTIASNRTISLHEALDHVAQNYGFTHTAFGDAR